MKKIKSVSPRSRKEWRAWLERNHAKEERVYLIRYKVHTGRPSPSVKECMDEAICFGWIDTTAKRLDDKRYRICYVKRNSKSRWSNATQSYARRLIKEGKMAPPGLKAYQEGLKKPVIDHGLPKNPDTPHDLKEALAKVPHAASFFEKLAPSYKRMFIYAVLRVKREETRKKWIQIVVEKCAAGKKSYMG